MSILKVPLAVLLTAANLSDLISDT